jgi:hypothetical protein
VASVAKRYGVGVLAFAAAAIWFNVGLIHGFACLFAFVLAFQAVRLCQRRSYLRSRRTDSRRERGSRSTPASARERDRATRAEPGTARSRPSGGVYDDGLQEPEWPMTSERTW